MMYNGFLLVFPGKMFFYCFCGHAGCVFQPKSAMEGLRCMKCDDCKKITHPALTNMQKNSNIIKNDLCGKLVETERNGRHRNRFFLHERTYESFKEKRRDCLRVT